MRTVVTFCMFSAQDLVTWIFTVVARNTVRLAEEKLGVPAQGKAGFRGIDRKRNKSVYWAGARPWQGLLTSDSTDRISVEAFSLLLYTMHSPTSSLAFVDRSVLPVQYTCAAVVFPTLTSPSSTTTHTHTHTHTHTAWLPLQDHH